MEAARDQLIDSIRAELFGPADGVEEVVRGRPAWRYLCGMLFPPDIDQSFVSDEEEEDEQGPEVDSADVSIALAYQSLPSSMGVSFFLSSATCLRVSVEAARYAPHEEQDSHWRRIPLASADNPLEVLLDTPSRGSSTFKSQHSLFDGRAEIVGVFRPRADGYLVTVTLVNRGMAEGPRPADQVAAMLFQCRFKVHVEGGEIGVYPERTGVTPHPEDEELSLIYRDRRTRGIGHGCSASWDAASAPVTSIAAEPVPTYTLRPLTTEIQLPDAAARALSLQWLASPRTERNELVGALERFVEEYENWISECQEKLAEAMPADRARVAARLVCRQKQAADRMRAGIRLLADDGRGDVRRAFRLAQETMLLQFAWAERANESFDLGGGEIGQIDVWGAEFEAAPAWRPFQLAFQLLTLDSLVDDTSPDRETLDLLWFPTGGGKTEAYLALIAFEIVLRRFRYGDAGTGTAAIMRYTLRLLTSQQFERAATMISVLEHFRRSRPELELGETPIRLGLWVGGDTSPNRLDSDAERSPGARQRMEQLLDESEPDNPFQLRSCPSCGTRLVPQRQGPEEAYGFHVDSNSFYAFCPDVRCVLHEGIPVSVVDDDLINRPPAFLIGTIDKFARMVWDARSRVFLGLGPRARGVLPPKLIVQDELHLINGPLGTIAGTYEAAIDTVLRQSGVVPKYIAATATIQRAQDQCQALYGRDAFTFPPAGLNADDSFFSREEEASQSDERGRGRTYLGAMGHGLYSGLTSLVQVSSAVAHAAHTLPKEPTRLRDAYWTQVIYHNSRQELGKTTTMLMDDVLSRLRLIEAKSGDERKFSSVEELSANIRGTQLTEALQKLRVSWPAEDVIDAVACTNIISVGVDVSRLGLMVVKSQPKTTAEYIQATSRVGRSSKYPPGVVVTLYAANRPRDRSHYEGFQAYHQSLYRTVEPTSVTPFSPPARDRTLHAALVLVLRHLMGWEESSDVKKFDSSDPEVQRHVFALEKRLRRACRGDEWQEIHAHLDALQTEWSSAIESAGAKLRFSARSKTHVNLLGSFPVGAGTAGEWPTLNSMRHVDGEVRFGVQGGGRR